MTELERMHTLVDRIYARPPEVIAAANVLLTLELARDPSPRPVRR